RRLAFLLLMLAPLWLSGCVTFERAPAPLSCDAQLVGRWVPLLDTAEGNASLTPDDYVLVDPQCKASLSRSKASDRSALTTELDARGFTLEGQSYLALADSDVSRLFTRSLPDGQQPPAMLKDRQPTQAVVLARYRIEGDIFSLAMIDFETVATLVNKKRLVANTTDQFNYTFTGDDAYLRKVLRDHPELFKEETDKPMRLKRAPLEPAPLEPTP
ncbi:MAG: hypothetical protein ABI858_04360, partial [Pseudoxanthomonas sp.]